MIAIREAAPDEIEPVIAFYESEGHLVHRAGTERYAIACEHGRIVGALRICIENGHVILRTMQVAADCRGAGLGLRLLQYYEALTRGWTSYCIPYRHLMSFYSLVGFELIEPESAPRHLQARLERYRQQGRDAVIMKSMGRGASERYHDLAGGGRCGGGDGRFPLTARGAQLLSQFE